MSEGGHEGVLGQVLGQLVVLHKLVAHGVHQPLVLLYQPRKLCICHAGVSPPFPLTVSM